MIDLNLGAELRALPSAFDPQHRGVLVQLGLPHNLMLHIDLRLARITTAGDFYEPSEDGKLAVIFAIHHGPTPSFACPIDPPPPVIDLVAIPLSQPRRFYLRAGTADLIGADRIASAHTWQSPLWLFDTALGWLAGLCDGVVVLDPEAARKLVGVSAVICDDRKSARRVRRLICRPPAAMPRILVLKKPAGRDPSNPDFGGGDPSNSDFEGTRP